MAAKETTGVSQSGEQIGSVDSETTCLLMRISISKIFAKFSSF